MIIYWKVCSEIKTQIFSSLKKITGMGFLNKEKQKNWYFYHEACEMSVF